MNRIDEFAKAALTGLLADNKLTSAPWVTVNRAYEIAELMEDKSRKVHHRRLNNSLDGKK